jgi:hypothetical protein
LLVEKLCATYPRLFHMAEAGSWKSIRRYGLLSTKALLDLFEIPDSVRIVIEDTRRPESVQISHPKHGTAVIRDQKPISDSALNKCLVGMSLTQWYQILNNRVFFWLSEDRLNGLLAARAYRDKEHCVLTVETRSLVESHTDAITLSPINSGSTIFRPQPRGPTTFSRIVDYPFDEWCEKRSAQKAVVELAVNYGVSDIAQHVLAVQRRRGEKVVETLWRR